VAHVLVSCYDLATGAPFVFSRADTVESVLRRGAELLELECGTACGIE
jgi:hypothetical protein